MMSSQIDSIISNKDIVIIHPYSSHEVQNPTFGGTRLIAEQIAYLKQKGNKVKVISLTQVGWMPSYLYRIQIRMRRKSIKKENRHVYNSERRRWFLNLVHGLFVEYFTRADILYRHSVNKLLESLERGSILIYHYPFGSRCFVNCARIKDLKFVLYEHNLEWQFFEERIGNGLVQRILVRNAKTIELDAIDSADLVAFASDRDRLSVLSNNPTIRSQTTSWIPIAAHSVSSVTIEASSKIREHTKGKIVVGFLGTNFEPNIVSVEHLIKLAKRSSEHIAFLIVGTVSNSFSERRDLPANMIFTGHVEHLDAYLSLCDVFINPKTTSDTGVETKMFDYLKFGKIILSTEIGARGFDSLGGVILTPVENMLEKIEQLFSRDAGETQGLGL